MDKEELNYAIKNGIIDLSHIQEQIEMKKNDELLSKHKYRIWKGARNRWYTYLPADNNGRTQISRSTEADIKKAVIEFYKKDIEKPKDFISAYKHWRSVQDNLVSNNTINKYDTDRKRYFDNTKFSKMQLSEITEEEIKVFIANTVKSQKLCKKACKTLFGYINNTIYSARTKGYITTNPMEFLKASQFYIYCTEKRKNLEDNIFSDFELNKLKERFILDYQNNPNYIPTYAVQLASFTGMRVGEIAALKWEDIHDKYFIINKSEKYDKINKIYFVDDTKNHKERIIPITKNILKLFTLLKYVEKTNGYLCEWVFANENGRVHSSIISSCLKTKCRQIGIKERGIHSFRKTLNSKMRCNGVSTTVAAALLGHTEEVNEKYYTFDVTDLDYKTKIMEAL